MRPITEPELYSRTNIVDRIEREQIIEHHESDVLRAIDQNELCTIQTMHFADLERLIEQKFQLHSLFTLYMAATKVRRAY